MAHMSQVGSHVTGGFTCHRSVHMSQVGSHVTPDLHITQVVSTQEILKCVTATDLCTGTFHKPPGCVYTDLSYTDHLVNTSGSLHIDSGV